MFDDVLHGVLERVEGARCVLLAGLDGMIVAAASEKGGPAPDIVAATLADLFRKVVAAHRDAGLAPPSEFTSGGERGQAVLRAVTDQYVLVAVLDGPGSLGRARFELRKAAAAILPEMV